MEGQDNKADTRYAPAEKASIDDIRASYHALKNDPVLRMFQEAMPDLALIVNKERQLVYANSNLIKFLDIEDPHLPLGLRLGNLINCIHSEDEPSGCGTTEACKYCGIVNAILQSQLTSKPVINEARITAVNDSEIISYDLKVKASPLIFQGDDYTIVSISDISDRKRRAILEQTYLTDVIGAASELNSVVSSIKKEELDENNLSIVETAEKVNHELMDDLLARKMLNEAEEGTLKIIPSRINSIQVIKEMSQYIHEHEGFPGRKLFIDPFAHSINFFTDTLILKRIFINILTNAFEASPADNEVRIGAKLNDRFVRFWIFNAQQLTEEATHQIFQRSFSTKGNNRGLGTYVARLLAVKYLKGNITFKSDKTGTTFFIEVPLNIE
ncbi:MAG TPA: ATP-binding protein [Lentimicrobium sp.]|nr:ATP-binding protein [Lentimicrobium sp.]